MEIKFISFPLKTDDWEAGGSTGILVDSIPFILKGELKLRNNRHISARRIKLCPESLG